MRTAAYWPGKKFVLPFLLGTVGLAAPLTAANIAPQGTGILGVNDAIDADGGVPRFNAGAASSINDNNLASRVDNWFDSLQNDKLVSYVGVVWPIKRYDYFSSLSLTLATFPDGGWFGVPGASPGPGGALSSAHLVEPTVQVTTNGGTTWVTVGHTSDYLTAMTGHGIGGGANPNPTSKTTVFTLNTPATQINGIRIIGTNGGLAGPDTNGFIGVFELETEAAPPEDTDADGMADVWEQANGLNVGVNDAGDDLDAGGLTNLAEFTADTNPVEPDTDNDGLMDGDEVTVYQTNPKVADSDGDGLNDGNEANMLFTDPKLADSDGDGLSDGAEVNTHHTNPLAQDSDGDGFNDRLEVAQGSNPNNFFHFPENFGLIGTALVGVKDSLTTGADTPYSQQPPAEQVKINDGNMSTLIATFNGATMTTVSYVGIAWPNLVTNPIVTLDLTMATFGDGGWFGVNNVAPGAGAALTSAHLTEPLVQVSTNGGADWSYVAFTSDYTNKLTGHRIGGGGLPNPTSVTVTFTLASPVTNINAIRIIGTEGGTASRGFLGVFEFAARTTIADTDNDGISDAWETVHGLTIGTNDASGDLDGDGLTNLGEFTAGADPQVADTDNDSLTDGAEVNVHHTDPTRMDTDGDGLNDNVEIATHHTNPLANDTDGDRFWDGMELAQGTDPLNQASLPSNFALYGSAIIGVKDTVDAGVESLYGQSGSSGSVNDGNLTTRVDTWNNAATSTASFVGILWNEPVAKPIVRLQLFLAIFFDGGWFGVNGLSPGSGNTLSAATHLAEPTVQVTTDGGTNWTTVAHTSDYLTALNGHPLPAADFGPPTTASATFQLTQAQTNINGIRIIGSEGGIASGGFLGVFELRALAHVAQSVSLLNVTNAAGQLRFEFDSQEGFNHAVQYKPSLNAAEWQTLATIPGDGQRKQVADPMNNRKR